MTTTTTCFNADLELLFGGEDSLLKPENFQQLIQVGCTGMLSTGLNHLRAFYWRVTLGTLSTEFDNWGKELSGKIDNYSVIKEESLPNLNKVQTDPLSAQMEDLEPKDNSGWRKYYHDLESAKFIQGDLERLYMAGVPEKFFQTKERQDLILNVLFVWSTIHSSTAYRQGMHEIAASILYVLQLELVAWIESSRFHPHQSTHPFNEVISENHLEAHTYWLFESIMKHIEPLYSPLLEKTGCPFIVNYCTNIQDDILPRLDATLSQHLSDCGVHSQLYGMRWARLLLGREFPLTANQSLRIWDYMFACCFNNNSRGSDNKVGIVRENKKGLLKEIHNDIKSVVEDVLVEVEDLDVKDSPLLKVLGQFMVAMILQIRKDLLSSDANEVLTMLMRYPPLEDTEPLIQLVNRIRSFNFNPKVVSVGAAKKSNLQSQLPFSNSKTSNSSETHTKSNPYQNPIFPDIPTSPYVAVVNVKSLSDSAFEEGFDDDEDDDEEEEEEEVDDIQQYHHHIPSSVPLPPLPPPVTTTATTTTASATPTSAAHHPRAAPPLGIMNSPDDLSSTMNAAAAEVVLAASAWSYNTITSLKQSLNFPSTATTPSTTTSANNIKSIAPAQQLRTFNQVPTKNPQLPAHKNHQDEETVDRRKESERVSERVRDVTEWLQTYIPTSYGTSTDDHCNMDQKSCKLTVEELVDLTARLSTLADILIGESSIKVYDHSYGSAKAAAVGRKATNICKATVKQNPNMISRGINRGVDETTRNNTKHITNTASLSTNIGNNNSNNSNITTATTPHNNENKSGNVKRILISDPLTLEF